MSLIQRFCFCFLGLAVGEMAHAEAKEGTTTRRGYRDIRWLGRGDAGVAAIRDGTAAFYNPAGLGLGSAFSVSLVNPQLSGNQNLYTTSSKLLTLTSGSESLTDKFSPFLGKPLAFSGSIFPHFAVPGFVGGFYSDASVDFQYRNPVYPEMMIDGTSSYGLILGSALEYKGRVAVGAALRYEKRQQVLESFDAASLLELTGRDLNSFMKSGEGYGLSLGVQFKQPLSEAQSLSLGLATRDVGYTRYKTTNRGVVPQRQRQSTALGVSYNFVSPRADAGAYFDFVDLEHTGESTTKRLRMGLDLSALMMDFRAGLHQGYWTAGLTIRLFPLLDLTLTSYGEELDSVAGLRENRVWMLGFSSGLDFKKKTVRRQRFTLDNL